MPIPTASTAQAGHLSGTGRAVRVALLGGFRLLAGNDVLVIPVGSERLLAFIALHHQAVGRLLVAGTLWSEVSECRAYAALRSALARMDRACRGALQVTPLSLELANGVAVDLRDARALAHRILGGTPSAEADLSLAAITSLSLDLLPLWYEDWVLDEAENWRQLRLHALETLSGNLTAAGRFGDATAAAAAAVRADPLRESAQAALIRVHLAEGNRSEALRTFDTFSRVLLSDLGLAPTLRLYELVADLLELRDAPLRDAGGRPHLGW
ncbi:AfsR/SARP family transcriptional regulator [Nocardia sp. CA-128927]|uniref:AfsR/SARP family transcriptional regulator n=1 Tax=Nocardia sp. CA-128927 TaxID=3239975 RepID=UPI003D953293